MKEDSLENKENICKKKWAGSRSRSERGKEKQGLYNEEEEDKQ